LKKLQLQRAVSIEPLLTGCVASTVDAVTHRAATHPPSAEMAQAVGLDMTAWWKPTAESYFQRVSKATILQAVSKYEPEHVNQLAKLKKADIASEAERLTDGTGWMPAIFKAEYPQTRMRDQQCHGTKRLARPFFA
jgi:ParB family chromosome partitioning protein